jgi:hypothetical protein
MKLVRAVCDCGFTTRKARSGRHFDQWWFPLYCTTTGALTDVLCALPAEDRKRIDRLSLDAFVQIPRDDNDGRREASARIERQTRRIREEFFESRRRLFDQEYAVQRPYKFDPRPGTVLDCPSCRNKTLTVEQVAVEAHCKSDCGHRHQWPDSEAAGCPKCGHRPHRFRTEIEPRLAGLPRTTCSCRCSSSTDCVSHGDGFCPKCGELPVVYETGGEHFCGIHHEPMLPYRVPANFLFVETDSRWVAEQFPNAKLWGDAPGGTGCVPGLCCTACESDHQRWLERPVLEGD